MALRSLSSFLSPALLGLLLCATGCASSRPPAVSADGLPLRRVVVYRNGVGYFERSGVVDGDKVSFRVRQNEVGDFLATMAVLEQGGSSVKSASFPLKVEDEQAPPDDEPMEPYLKPVPREDRKKDDPNRLVNVSLELDGKEHDLQVGYVAEMPVWRPSYRLVVLPSGQAELQAWGIIQNLSGEDWRGVSLSLVAGAPLAFQPTLGTPVIPERPTVTDSGEVIAAVPQGETSLSQSMAAAPVMPEEAEVEAEKDDARASAPTSVARAAKKKADSTGLGSIGMIGSGTGGGGRGYGYSGPMAQPAPMAEAMMARQVGSVSTPRNLSALAAVAVEGSTTRYDIPTPVTVPDKSATMVLLVSTKVAGESIFLFSPDPGVPSSNAHPFRVARFTNQTSGLLERGPIAVFEGGAFLGQGMVDPLPPAATATVPFALERSLAIDLDNAYGEEGARLAKIEAGEIFIERDYQFKTRYRIQNGTDQAAKLLIKHPRRYNTRLVDAPKGTEDNVGTQSALIPVDVAARATGEQWVDERTSSTRAVDWTSSFADEAVKSYMADPRADQVVVAQLRAAWDIRPALIKANEEERALRDESDELIRANNETRENLKALEKNTAAGALRKQLTDRLAAGSARANEVSKNLVEVRLRINEQRVRFNEAVRSIKMLKPLSPQKLAARLAHSQMHDAWPPGVVCPW